MKHILTILLSTLVCLSASAQIKWHDAADLTIIGKPIPTSKPFARIFSCLVNNISSKILTPFSTQLFLIYNHK